MIDFMVIGLPRSGTSWAANWLTTDHSICLHDPLALYDRSDLDRLSFGSKKVGVSCTGLWMFPRFLEDHPCEKVILHRDLNDINEELAVMGLPKCTHQHEMLLDHINGYHFHYSALFDNPKPMWEILMGYDMDEDRHRLLKDLAIAPYRMTIDLNLMNKIRIEYIHGSPLQH